MPEAGRVMICASCVVVAAGFAHLARPACPAAPILASDRVVTDDVWGSVINLDSRETVLGEEFTATQNNGRHRVIRTTTIAAPGRYRISIDTRYLGTAHFAIEAGGPHQPYTIATVDLKHGVIDKIEGAAIAAGVEAPIGQTGTYRWWIEIPLNPGEFDYNFALLSAYGLHDFPGTGICRVTLSNPSVRRVDNAR
jgi:hypothetical protein